MPHQTFKLTSRYNSRPIVVDVLARPSFRFQPLIIFAHGFNGFKDWGPFPAMAERFADAGFAFCAFNFSHNGTTPERPTEFEDLEAYRANTISIELSDLEDVIHFFAGGKSASEGALIDKRHIGLMGHSRGASVALLAAAQGHAKALVTLSAMAAFDRTWPEDQMQTWAEDGVRLVQNRRTGQKLPLGYSIVQDYKANFGRLDLIAAANSYTNPWLIVHGDQDETIPVTDAMELSMAQPGAATLILPGQGHTYGAAHPSDGTMPPGFAQAVDASIAFYKANL